MSFSEKWAKISKLDTGNLHCNNCKNQNDGAESIFAIIAIENPGALGKKIWLPNHLGGGKTV